MNICVIGDRGLGQRSHFSENILLAFRDLGHKTDFLACEDIQSMVSKKQWKLYRSHKVKVKLLDYITPKYDFIFIDQCDLEFYNDLILTPVFFNMKYLHRRFGVFYPTVALFLTSALQEWCERIKAPNECYNTKYQHVMASCTELDTYHPREKIYEGISWFGSRNNGEEEIDHLELMSISQRTLYRWEEKILRKLDIRMFETPVPTRKYRELLPQCEAFFMSIPRGQFISRMIFEAMACKTLCIFEIQSKRHERELESLGFINGEHYIGIDKIKNLQWIYDSCGIKKRY